MQVECDIIVPGDVASGKQEFAARTLRPKVMNVFEDYLEPPPATQLKKSSLGLRLGGEKVDVADHPPAQARPLGSTGEQFFRGGTKQPRKSSAFPRRRSSTIIASTGTSRETTTSRT